MIRRKIAKQLVGEGISNLKTISDAIRADAII